jgi:hypothetical protein
MVLLNRVMRGEARSTAPPQADLVVATYNARYTHTALGIRWLVANLGPAPPTTVWHEIESRVPPAEAAQRILAHHPRLVALGVYIWNARLTTELMQHLRQARPDLIIVLGGPEVSAAPAAFAGFALADAVIVGEAEQVFAPLCRNWLQGIPPEQKIIPAPLPDLTQVTPPYYLYSDTDLKQRHIYVETTRGCPFRCDFCTSGGPDGIREYPLAATLDAIVELARRGVGTLRFVDRTFNARPERAAEILNTLRPWADQGLRLHLEFTPQAVYPDALQAALCAWPPGALHIEVGIQSLNVEVARRVHRPGASQSEAALQFLLHTARAEVHADLIVGLPGESFASIADSFDRLFALGPQEIQVGILKNLPGTPLCRHSTQWGLCFDAQAPYSLQSSRLLSAATLQELTHFAVFWEKMANHQQFPETLPLVLATDSSPFAAFSAWSNWAYAQLQRTHSIPLDTLYTLIHRYLTDIAGQPAERVRQALNSDFLAGGRRPARSLPIALRTTTRQRNQPT